jgi:deazaflavin-dependent oxidoreductase (nitroreductase family)
VAGRLTQVVRRGVGRVAATETFARYGPRVAPVLDGVARRLSGGRWTFSDAVLPVVVLTTTGARSGLPRTVPLASLVDGQDFIVVGSNFGRERHPAWSANLLAHPDARVSFRGEDFAVRAVLLSVGERDRVWPRLTAQWPLFDRYVETSGRDLRVFRLERRRPSVI